MAIIELCKDLNTKQEKCKEGTITKLGFTIEKKGDDNYECNILLNSIPIPFDQSYILKLLADPNTYMSRVEEVLSGFIGRKIKISDEYRKTS